VLSRIIAESPLKTLPADLLVGIETADDAAVYRLNDTQAVVATTDFFMPIVDDPRDFGRIAAANALSDVYAMGGRPIFALAIVGMPIAKLPEDVIHTILEGGASICAEAGIPIAGGHSIDAPEPIYGLVAIGIVHPDQVKANKGAQDGDVLILGKPLGIGILSAVLAKGLLSPAGYEEMVRWTTKLNTTGTRLAEMPGVHAITDVTGFGLGGHLLEICRGSKLDCTVDFGKLPLIDEAVTHVKAGIATGASARNWASYGESVTLPLGMPEWQQKMITDPQTSGGLLVACAPEDAEAVLAAFRADGFERAAVIGGFSSAGGVSPRLTFTSAGA
jgi:selenide, water dikinase